MKTTQKFSEERIWSGLNRPDISVDEADIVVFGIPFDGSVSFRAGAAQGPAAIRGITHLAPPTTEYFENLSPLKIKDLGDFETEDRAALFKSVEDAVAGLVEKGKFFTMIGGDHSVTIPVLKGIDRAIGHEFGVVHIDAHFDLSDEFNGDIFSHGCTERRATELQNVGGPGNLFFIGIRSIELDEYAYIKANPVNVINAAKLSEIGVRAAIDAVKQKLGHLKSIYLTVDIDCLDPAYAAGTGTPQFGGMTARELLTLLRGLFDLPIIGFDIVEVAPSLDPSLAAVFAARRILTECWAHHTRQTHNWKSVLE